MSLVGVPFPGAHALDVGVETALGAAVGGTRWCGRSPGLAADVAVGSHSRSPSRSRSGSRSSQGPGARQGPGNLDRVQGQAALPNRRAPPGRRRTVNTRDWLAAVAAVTPLTSPPTPRIPCDRQAARRHRRPALGGLGLDALGRHRGGSTRSTSSRCPTATYRHQPVPSPSRPPPRSAETRQGSVREASAPSPGALLGARGNSGIILSQLIAWGVAETSPRRASRPSAKHELMVTAFRRAADSAYAAVAAPREGTVLSVARAAADAVAGLGRARTWPGSSPPPPTPRPGVALAPEQLDVLRRAGVVDARGPRPRRAPRALVRDGHRRYAATRADRAPGAARRRRVRRGAAGRTGDVPPRRRGRRGPCCGPRSPSSATRWWSSVAAGSGTMHVHRRHRRLHRGRRGRRAAAPDPRHRPPGGRPLLRAKPHGRAVVAVATVRETAALLETRARSSSGATRGWPSTAGYRRPARAGSTGRAAAELSPTSARSPRPRPTRRSGACASPLSRPTRSYRPSPRWPVRPRARIGDDVVA